MRFNVWYVFRNKKLKDKFLEEICFNYGFVLNESIINAEALMLKSKDTHLQLCYRSTVNPDYMTEEIVNYEGEKCMCNCGAVHDKVNKELDYPVQEYFKDSLRELEDDKNEKIRNVIKETEIYKSAKDFADKCKKNDVNCSLDPYDMCNYGTVLPASAKKKIDEITKDFNEAVDELSKECRVLSNLLYQADTFEQRLDLMREYGVIK